MRVFFSGGFRTQKVYDKMYNSKKSKKKKRIKTVIYPCTKIFVNVQFSSLAFF